MILSPTKTQQTAALLRARRAMGFRDRRRRIPRQQYPKPIEREYARRILDVVEECERALAPYLLELPLLLDAEIAARADSWRHDAGAITRWIDRVAERLKQIIAPTRVEALAQEFAQRTSTHQRLEIGKQVKAALGADVFAADARVPVVMDAFVAENVQLITKIPARVAEDIGGIVTRAVTAATPTGKVIEELQARFSFTKDRARLIARDQIGKLNGKLNEVRQKDMGVTHYFWRTMNDERVRGDPDGKYPNAEFSHFHREGERFAWAEPPEDGHAGIPVNCRCYPEPDFSGILGAI